MMRLSTLLSIMMPLWIMLLPAIWLVARADKDKWGYTGDQGPENWGALAPEYALCADGSAQSPIDIRDAIDVELVEIELQYGESGGSIVNNGHTIQVDIAAGSSIIYNGITYDLLQFHFHAPSEHTIDGEAAPMEIHFVHQDPNSNNLAVVGILLSEGEGDNAAYAAIFDQLPTEAGEPEALGDSLSLMHLLPEKRGFYTYQGSLTTPPCSETVRWLLLDEPVALSRAQIEAYTALYSGNARPVQPLGKRDLLHSQQ